MNNPGNSATPATRTTNSACSKIEFNQYFNGAKPLWKAFWILYVGGSLLITLLLATLIKSPALFELAYHVKKITRLSPDAPLIITISIIISPYIGYSVFCLIATWRCARNTNSKTWSILAKSVVALHAGWTLATLFTASKSMVNYFI